MVATVPPTPPRLGRRGLGCRQTPHHELKRHFGGVDVQKVAGELYGRRRTEAISRDGAEDHGASVSELIVNPE